MLDSIPGEQPNLWTWRPEIIFTLALAGVLFTLGWWRLRAAGQRRLATGWRLASYLAGLAVLAITLMSAIDSLAESLFSMHMIQHLLLVMVAPPLLLIAYPAPFVLWGLPARTRHTMRHLLGRKARVRQGVRWLTRPGLVWLAFVALVVGWHDPNAYSAALRNEWLHNVEHLSFFGAALLYWWHVAGATPRVHSRLPYGLRIAYVLAMVPVAMGVGIAISFASQPIYAYYATVPRVTELTVLQDQMLGGVIMWIPGSMMYLAAALVLVARVLQREERRPQPSISGPAADTVTRSVETTVASEGAVK